MNEKKKTMSLSKKSVHRVFAYKKILISILLILIIAAFFIINKIKESTIAVDAYTLSETDMEDVFTEKGRVKQGEKMHIISKVSGAVEEVAVFENSLVKKGDLLIRIDKRDLNYQKQLRESNLNALLAKKDESDINQLMRVSPTEYLKTLNQSLASAEAAYSANSSEYRAKQELGNTGAIAPIEIEAARANYESSKTAYESAKIRRDESKKYLEELKKEGLTEADINEKFYKSIALQLDSAIEGERAAIEQIDKQIEDCEIRADADGIVIALPVKDLSMVGIGQELVLLAHTATKTQVECEVLTDIVPYLHTGDSAKIRWGHRGVDTEYAASIKEIYDFANEGKSAIGLKEYRVKVILEIQEGEGASPKDGYGVDVDFSLYKNEHTLAVPLSAIFEYDDKDYLFKIVKGKAVLSPVTIEYKSSLKAVISEGAVSGDIIILNADTEGLEDGKAVRY